jgi:transposase InsO family protein
MSHDVKRYDLIATGALETGNDDITNFQDTDIFKGLQDTLKAIFEYIEVFYNRKRKHSTLGYQTPTEFKQVMKSEGCF